MDADQIDEAARMAQQFDLWLGMKKHQSLVLSRNKVEELNDILKSFIIYFKVGV